VDKNSHAGKSASTHQGAEQTPAPETQENAVAANAAQSEKPAEGLAPRIAATRAGSGASTHPTG